MHLHVLACRVAQRPSCYAIHSIHKCSTTSHAVSTPGPSHQHALAWQCFWRYMLCP
jgi:hypothetical protein